MLDAETKNAETDGAEGVIKKKEKKEKIFNLLSVNIPLKKRYI